MPTDTATPTATTQAVRTLAGLGPLRVWSVLVTVFGDLSFEQPLRGPALSAIMAGIGIKPEATRVALHRLRSDGWITSEKTGRTSLHRLTDAGRARSIAARPRIYGTPDQIGHTAHFFATSEPLGDLDTTRCAQIAPRLYVCGDAAHVPADALRLCPRNAPDWVADQIETDTLRDGYHALLVALKQIDATLPATISDRDTAVVRVLVVHGWRRLALKHPDLPRALHSADWCGHECRAAVTHLLARLGQPDLDSIDAP